MTEERLRLATFTCLVVVTLLMIFVAVVNWLAFEHRKQMFAQMAELAQRIEAVEHRTSTQILPRTGQQGSR